MSLEQQLAFEFMADIEKEEKKQERIEGYKFLAKLGTAGGYAILIIGLTNKQGFADDPFAIAIPVIGMPYLSTAGFYVIDKTSDFIGRVKENLRNFYSEYTI